MIRQAIMVALIPIALSGAGCSTAPSETSPMSNFKSFEPVPDRWPTNWSEFESPPPESYRDRTVVHFTPDLDTACKNYQRAERVEEQSKGELDAIVEPMLIELQVGAISEEEFMKKKRDVEMRNNRHNIDLVAAATEVMRQHGDPDWQMFSRHNLSGVGDLWRKHLGESVEVNSQRWRFRVVPFTELKAICG